MVSRRPLVLASGLLSELPPGDTVVGADVTVGTLTAGSGLSGGGNLATNQRVDVSLVANPSGIIFVGNQLGLDGVAQRTADTALSSGNAALSNTATLFSRSLTAGSGLLGGGTLSSDLRFDANISTQAVAQSGTDNTTLMTPLRVAQAIAVQGSSYSYTSTGVAKTLVNRERCTAISGFIVLSLPSAPSQGNEVSVIIPSGSSNVVISGTGSPIMGLQQDLTVDSVDKTLTLVYIDGNYGWRVF